MAPAPVPAGQEGVSTKSWPKSLFVGLGILLICIVVVSWYEESPGKSPSPNVPQVLAGEGGLVALAWTDKGEVASDGSDSTVRLWIQVENHAPTAITHLRMLAFHTPGFKEEAPCWPNHLPSCRPDTPKGTPPQGLPETLDSGNSSIVYADIKSTSWYGSHSANGILSWQENANTWEQAFVLPPVQITSNRGQTLASLGKLLNLLKDLALPLVLVIFGSYLQNQAKQKEQDKADRDKEQTQIQQTWAMMLPRFQNFAENHYMPVSASIEAFVGAGDVTDEKKSREALFELLRLNKRMRHLALSAGGLFFRDREAEALASTAWRLFLDRVREELIRENLERATSMISIDETYPQFIDKLTGKEPRSSEGAQLLESLSALLDLGNSKNENNTHGFLHEIETNFNKWKTTQQFTKDKALLTLFGQILSYEMNRPYLYWYPDPAEFPAEEFEKALNDINPNLPGSKSGTDLKGELKSYLEMFKNGKEQVKTSTKRVETAPLAASPSPSVPPGQTKPGGKPERR